MTIQTTPSGHTLAVTVVKATQLKATNFFSQTSDAYVALSMFGEQETFTEVSFSTTDPEWNETKQFELTETPLEDVLFVTVWGRHRVSKHSFIGRFEVPLATIIQSDELKQAKDNNETEFWFKLLPQYGYKNYSNFSGKVLLKFKYSYVAPVEQPTNTITTPFAQPTAPQGMVLHYQCPKCTKIFAPSAITAHLQQCKATMQQAPVVQSPIVQPQTIATQTTVTMQSEEDKQRQLLAMQLNYQQQFQKQQELQAQQRLAFQQQQQQEQQRLQLQQQQIAQQMQQEQQQKFLQQQQLAQQMQQEKQQIQQEQQIEQQIQKEQEEQVQIQSQQIVQQEQQPLQQLVAIPNKQAINDTQSNHLFMYQQYNTNPLLQQQLHQTQQQLHQTQQQFPTTHFPVYQQS